VCFIALSFFFYVPNVARFDAGMLKLQRMIKWDVFWDMVYIVCLFILFASPLIFFPFTYLFL